MSVQLNSIPSGAIRLEQGEELHVYPGKMQATNNISMITEWASGFWESFKRLFWGAGPGCFNNVFKANEGGGWILLEESRPGQFVELDLSEIQNKGLKFRRDCWLASSPGVQLDTAYEGLPGLLQGTGIAMLEASLKADAQKGKIFFHCQNGTVKKIEINPQDKITIDNDSIIAYTPGLERSFRMAGEGVSSLMFGEENLVCDFSGKGTVYIASAPQDREPAQTVIQLNMPQRDEQSKAVI